MIPIHCTTAWLQGHTGLLPAIYTQAASSLVSNVLPPPPNYCAHLIRVPFHRTPSPLPPTHTPPLSTLPNSIGHPLGMLTSPTTHPSYRKVATPTPTTHSEHHSRHLSIDQPHLHFVSRCTRHCCQFILSAYGESWPSLSFKETGTLNSCG